MTESRDVLMIVYDFIRSFNCGIIRPNDINEILQDIKRRYNVYAQFQL